MDIQEGSSVCVSVQKVSNINTSTGLALFAIAQSHLINKNRQREHPAQKGRL